MSEDTKPNTPSGPFARTATLEGHKPPVDGSKLPPITGDVKIEMAADGMVSKPLPPITGNMATTEPSDQLGRRKLKLPATK